MDIKKYHPSAWFFVGLGNAQWFHARGIENFTELDWWEEGEIKLTLRDYEVTSVARNRARW